MKYTVNHHSVQLIFHAYFELPCVVFYTIDGNEQITRARGSLAVIKSDDVCKRVVLKVVNIHFVQVIIRAENVVDFTQRFVVKLDHQCYPRAHLLAIFQGKGVVFGEEVNQGNGLKRGVRQIQATRWCHLQEIRIGLPSSSSRKHLFHWAFRCFQEQLDLEGFHSQNQDLHLEW